MRFESFTAPLRNHVPTSLCLALALAGLAPAQVLEARLGAQYAEGPGLWFEGRNRFDKASWGIHMGFSRIDLVTWNAGIIQLKPDGQGINQYTTIPATSETTTATLYQLGLVVGSELYQDGSWVQELNTGAMIGILGGTPSNSAGLATNMVLLPLFLDATWFPNKAATGSFAILLGGGGVLTIPSNAKYHYEGVSLWRWQARTGLVF